MDKKSDTMKFIKDYPIKDLIPNANNPRKNDTASEKLVPMIEKFGFVNPIIIDQNRIIRAGHTRLKTAQKMGVETVPVIEIKFKTKADALAYSIADNKSAEFAEWDFDFLKLELDELNKDGFDMELTGFNPDEIDDIIGIGKDVEEDDFDVDNAMKEPKYKINVGDVWTLGKHRLVCGDSTKEEDVKLLMDGKKADMVFTDPPYSVNYSKKENEILGNKEYNKIINDDMDVKQISKEVWSPAFRNMYNHSNDLCSFYVTMPQGGDQMMMMMMMVEHWKVKHELIWLKESPVFSMNRLDYDYKHEPIMYGWKKKHKFYGKGKFTNSIWQIERNKEKKIHPTMKPIELVANAINNSSKRDMIVLDLFGGSGSTLIACEQTNRIAYMMELDQTYISVILERWETLTGKQAIRITKGNDKI